MLKGSLLFLSLLVLMSCVNMGNLSTGERHIASMQEQHDGGLWVSGPINGQLVIIGVSGRLSRADDEIQAAKQDAAYKVSLFYGIQGWVELSNVTGSGGFFDYEAETRHELHSDPNFEQYIEHLSFDKEKDVIRGNGATFIRFRYNAPNLDIDFSPRISGGQPAWVNNRNLPEFAGYTTAVGHAGRRERLRDTVKASYDSVALRLIEHASTQVTTRDTSFAGHSSGSVTHIQSEGSLMNFQVLGMWIDPNNGSVSTLAIARVSK